MLNIEVVRFEAQDVITASVAAPHVCQDFTVTIVNPLDAPANTFTCNGCGTAYAGKNEGGQLVPDFTKVK